MSELKPTADVIADLERAMAATRAASAVTVADEEALIGDHRPCPVRYVAGHGSHCMAHHVEVDDDGQEV